MFHCSHCDAQYLNWEGRCRECGKWGTILAAADKPRETAKPSLTEKISNHAAAEVIDFENINIQSFPRLATKISEINRVLGGGIVPGSLILLSGDPGIGKSTLVLQIINSLENNNQTCLYVSGEESAPQIKSRTDRLNIDTRQLKFAAETNIEAICKTITEIKPALVIIDSIQTMNSEETDAETGSPNQIRAASAKLMAIAKSYHLPIIIIGHITKDGAIAGPKILEHLVDVVLYLEGEEQSGLRLLRSQKNRFGSTNEVGVFEMTGEGLKEVKNPSASFLSGFNNIPGTVITCSVEGSRAFLLEIQALATKTVFGYPQRKSVGYDLNRLQLLIAVLTKRLGLPLGASDIYLNIVGGMKIAETAADLAICAAIISSIKNEPIADKTIIFGEVGLGGEVRNVAQIDKRLKEAENLGFRNIILPSSNIVNDKFNLKKITNLKELP